MNERPKIRLSRLRDIGWSLWDPIGLKHLEGDWQESDAADEYDGYLLKVAGMLRNNEPHESAVEYLVWAETENMGLSGGEDTRPRAEAVVKAISEAKDLWSDSE